MAPSVPEANMMRNLFRAVAATGAPGSGGRRRDAQFCPGWALSTGEGVLLEDVLREVEPLHGALLQHLVDRRAERVLQKGASVDV